MASIRYRNGRYYWRRVVRGSDGKRHWQERGGFASFSEALAAAPKKVYPPFQLTDHLVQIIFERFPEKHPAHIPLKLMYYTGCTLEEAYDIRIDDVDFDNETWLGYDLGCELTDLLRKQLNRILDSRLIYLYPDRPEYFNIYLQTGKKIDKHQIYYVTKVIRREINPNFRKEAFRCTKSISSSLAG